MKQTLILIFFVFSFAEILSAQENQDTIRPSKTDTILNSNIKTDSSHHIDSATGKKEQAVLSKDSVFKRKTTNSLWLFDSGDFFTRENLFKQLLFHNPYFDFHSAPLKALSEKKESLSKEVLFYVMIIFLLVFGSLKNLFPRYFSDLFRHFFRTSLKQRQIREQLMQAPLPSSLFNGFFVVTLALYIDFLLQHYHLMPFESFWLMFLYCCAGISIIYLVKFGGLKIAGWLFNMKRATDSYIFIVFIINKMIGIFLLPFLVLLAFTRGNIYMAVVTLSWCVIAFLLLYRFVLSYRTIRKEVKFNLFHFLLYLIAFEAAPLLLIYKVVLFFFR